MLGARAQLRRCQRERADRRVGVGEAAQVSSKRSSRTSASAIAGSRAVTPTSLRVEEIIAPRACMRNLSEQHFSRVAPSCAPTGSARIGFSRFRRSRRNQPRSFDPEEVAADRWLRARVACWRPRCGDPRCGLANDRALRRLPRREPCAAAHGDEDRVKIGFMVLVGLSTLPAVGLSTLPAPPEVDPFNFVPYVRASPRAAPSAE